MRHMIALSSLFAALTLAAPQVLAQTAANQGKFCLKGGEPATTTCTYDTMAQCEAAKKGTGDQCAPNTGTTGAAPAGASPMAPAQKY